MDYIINMLARPKKITTSQMDEKNVDKAMNIYLKNAIVSLCSVKIHNPEIECLLYVNFNVEKSIHDLLYRFGIKIILLDFGDHSIGDQYNWNIVNYRYDVMRNLCNFINDSDRIIMLDTDTICINKLTAVYKEIGSHLLMYDVQHSLDHKDREAIINNYKKLYGCDSIITHYGGEFIGANGLLLKKLYQACCKVIKDSNDITGLTNWNDEHITSIAINNDLIYNVRNANAYINRYWTGRGFYLTSTNYISNPVSIWHIPNEKRYGFLIIYKYFLKHADFPKVGRMAKIFGFHRAKRPFSIKFYSSRTINRILSSWNK